MLLLRCIGVSTDNALVALRLWRVPCTSSRTLGGLRLRRVPCTLGGLRLRRVPCTSVEPLAACACCVFLVPLAACACGVFLVPPAEPLAACAAEVFLAPLAACAAGVFLAPLAACACEVFLAPLAACVCEVFLAPLAACACAVLRLAMDDDCSPRCARLFNRCMSVCRILAWRRRMVGGAIWGCRAMKSPTSKSTSASKHCCNSCSQRLDMESMNVTRLTVHVYSKSNREE